ncbi:MAG: YraN family protein [Prevotellaceae bacterium]|jgi:putative endonuclease|nr:YraN family protein [Prevotellaceae bacterium]
MSVSYDLGRQGEKKAVAFLQKKGYTVIDTNWRYRHREIDIIAEYSGALHIVEVKTRTSAVGQTIDEIVGIAKQKNMIAAADAYVQQNGISRNVVFDIVYIIQTAGNEYIKLIEDAFHACDTEI